MDEHKENSDDVNYIKKHLCPKALCPNHGKKYCKVQGNYYFCDGCLKDIKKPQLKRNKVMNFNF